MAKDICEGIPASIEFEELVNVGNVGLLKAAAAYDPSRGAKFETFARYRIRGAILDYLRSVDTIRRALRQKQKGLERATLELESKLQREPAESELAEHLGIEAEQLHGIKALLARGCPVSLSVWWADEEGQRDWDMSSPAPSPDQECAFAELRQLLEEALATLPARYAQVVRLYYSGELRMREIADILGVGEGRISQIHSEAIHKLRGALSERGIDSAAVV